MNNRMIINYVPGPTVLHKLTGFTKVFLFLVMSAAIISTQDVRILIPLFVINVIEIASMKPNLKPIIIMFTITFFTVTLLGNIFLWLVSPAAGKNSIGVEHIIWQSSGRLYLSKEFLWYMLAVFIKRTTSFVSVVAFALATTPSEFASGLNKCGLNYKVCTIVSLAYRTIPDIANDFINIRNSMMMRGVELSRKASIFKRLKNTVLILVPLIFTSFGKVSNIANAMDLRGYGKKEKRTWYAEHELTKWDKPVRILTIILLLSTIYYILRYRIIDPWPADIWCPWVSKDEIEQINKLDTLFFMKWFK